LELKIDNAVVFYKSSLWEAGQYILKMNKDRTELTNALTQQFELAYIAQPVLIYVADYFVPALNTMLFARWEEHEHGEAYFRELRMQQEVEELGYKVMFYASDDLKDIPKMIERLKA
jgi:hypothetical protein